MTANQWTRIPLVAQAARFSDQIDRAAFSDISSNVPCTPPVCAGMSKFFSAALAVLFAASSAIGQTERPKPEGSARAMNERFERHGPKPGELAPDFQLKTTAGKTIRASELWKEKPTVIMTASFSCPVFRNQAPGFETLTTEFGERVAFLLVYTLEAHPKGEASPYFNEERVGQKNVKDGLIFPQPKTLEERVQHAEKCERTMKLSAPMVIDAMDNKTWKAYGSAPNAAYLVGTDGKIVEQQGWFDPQKMKSSISKYLEQHSKPAGK
jgi:hypothetical protein